MGDGPMTPAEHFAAAEEALAEANEFHRTQATSLATASGVVAIGHGVLGIAGLLAPLLRWARPVAVLEVPE